MNSDLKKRNAEVLKKWLDGVEIQTRLLSSKLWFNVQPYSEIDVHVLHLDNKREFRLKPKTVKVRVALFKRSNGELFTLSYNDINLENKGIEGSKQFIRWLGDWQEVSEDDPNS